MWVRQQAEIPILIQGSLEGVASPHHRTVAHVQQIVIADHLAGVNTSLVPWRKPDRREARVNRVMLRKGSHGHSNDGAENLQPERHLSVDVGVNGELACDGVEGDPEGGEQDRPPAGGRRSCVGRGPYSGCNCHVGRLRARRRTFARQSGM